MILTGKEQLWKSIVMNAIKGQLSRYEVIFEEIFNQIGKEKSFT
jgi:hypothetical protein